MDRFARLSEVFACSAVIALLPARAAEARDRPKPQGVVIAIGDVDAAAALEAAREEGGARWRSETITAVAAARHDPPRERAGELRRLYLEADFLHCLGTMQTAELDRDALLSAGHRDLAALVTVFGAACAYGAGDEALARRGLERLLAAELDRDALGETTPEFQHFAEEIDHAIQARGSVTLHLQTRPAEARIELDGRPVECDEDSCVLRVKPGSHVLRAMHLGYAPRSEILDIAANEARTLALDPAPSAVIRSQLAAALAEDEAPDRQDIAEAAADAFGARVVVVAWRDGSMSAALVYDRGLRTTVARARAPSDRNAIREVVAEWRGVTEPASLVSRPAFWLTTAAVAAAAGLTAFFLTRPTEKHYVLAVP